MPRRGSSKPPAEPVVKPYGCDFRHVHTSLSRNLIKCMFERLNAYILNSGNRDFNLDDIILNSVNDIFINTHFISISMKHQIVFLCI